METNDIELLRQLDDPNLRNEAFAVFYQRYKRYLFGICRKSCSQFIEGNSIAEDVFQNTMLKVYAKGSNFKLVVELKETDVSLQIKAWLGRIAHNELIDFLRSNPDEKNLTNRFKMAAEELADVIFELPNNTADADRTKPSINRQKLDAALEQLSEKERHVLITYMQYFDQNNADRHLPDEVINNLCQSLKTTAVNIRQIKSRALKKLKTILST